MKVTVRALVGSLLVALATMVLAGCNPYDCQATFGASTCTPSGSGLGGGGGTGGTGGGGGGSAPAVLAYNIVQTGSVNGIVYTAGTTPAFGNITGFTAPVVPGGDISSELVTAQGKYLYGVFPSNQSLYAWSISPTTGALTAVSGTPYTVAGVAGIVLDTTGVNLSGMITNPAGTFLFIADANDQQILSYQIGTGGALTAGPTVSTVGAVIPWNLATDGLGKYLYVTTGPEGDGAQVAVYAINASTGALTLVGSPLALNIWQLQGEPTGQFMIGISGNSPVTTGVIDNHIHVFSIMPSGATAGTLSEVAGSPFTTQYAPSNIAFEPNANNGSFLYSFSSAALSYNPIEGYALNASTGALTVLASSPFTGVTDGPWGQFDQSGNYLFVYGNLAGTAPELTVLNVATGTGLLTQSVSTLPLATGGYFAVTDPQ